MQPIKKLFLYLFCSIYLLQLPAKGKALPDAGKTAASALHITEEKETVYKNPSLCHNNFLVVRTKRTATGNTQQANWNYIPAGFLLEASINSILFPGREVASIAGHTSHLVHIFPFHNFW